jgi:hypothetical protein
MRCGVWFEISFRRLTISRNTINIFCEHWPHEIVKNNRPFSLITKILSRSTILLLCASSLSKHNKFSARCGLKGLGANSPSGN